MNPGDGLHTYVFRWTLVSRLPQLFSLVERNNLCVIKESIDYVIPTKGLVINVKIDLMSSEKMLLKQERPREKRMC